MGPGAATHTTRLVDLRLQPIAAWEHACAATGGCTFTGEYRTGMRMRGRTDPSGYVATVPLGAWGRAFPWAAYPRSLQAAYDGGWRYAVGFAGGDGVRIAYRAGGWSRDGPAALGGAGDTHADGRRIALRHGFPSDQVLLEWRTEITAATAITTATRFHIREERESRRGVLRTIEVSAERQVDGLLSLRWRDDDSDGLVQFRRDDMGWRVDAYWTTRGGALLRAGGHAYATGLWLGDLEGWRPLDTREPSESAEWTMLPDGTFASLLLFRQEDGSFVDLRTYSPSEGAAPSLFA